MGGERDQKEKKEKKYKQDKNIKNLVQNGDIIRNKNIQLVRL